MKRIMKLCTVLLLLLAVGCAHEERDVGINGSMSKIVLRLDCATASKSSTIVDESLINDLNIWLFDSSGSFAESHYMDELSIHSSGSVSFDSSVGGHSLMVVIGNAGRELTPPLNSTGSVAFRKDYPLDASGIMLLIGQNNLSMTSTGLYSNITMNRLMSRIALSASLSDSFAASGAVLGDNVRIREVKFCNSPAVFSVQPSAAWQSSREFKAVSGTPFQTGDRLSNTDLATLQSGGTVYLYSLPNYTNVDYSDRPSNATQYSSYLEMTLDFDTFGSVSAGSAVCRFYANDGSTIGLQGGCSYRCAVTISNNMATNSWRKDDYRFEIPDAMLAGTLNEVALYSTNHTEGEVLFSLSETPGVEENETFALGGATMSSGYCTGVKVIPKRNGTGVLYAFDSSGRMMASVPLTAVYPTITVSMNNLDVSGETGAITISGLEEAYASRASDALFQNLYSVASIASENAVAGLYPGDFLTVDKSGMRMYVSRLSWTRNGATQCWEDAVGLSFPYRLTLQCGVNGVFDARVVNDIVGRFAATTDYGEVINTSAVPNPKSVVRVLDGRNITISRTGVELPSSFSSAWKSNGWSSWYGGSVLVAGYSADSYLTRLENGLRWNFGEAVTQGYYAGDIPVYIGKKNPWCDEYVRVSVGTYSSTRYIPVGLEYMFYQVGFDYGGQINGGNNGMEVYTMLIFKEHSSDVSIAWNYGKRGDAPHQMGAAYLNLTDSGTARWTENDRQCCLISYNGDYYEYFNTGLVGGRQIEESSAFATKEIWENESNSGADKYRFASAAYGGTGTFNRWVYLYCPYTSPNAYIANSAGHITAKGEVLVHLWSVSEKTFFEYQPQRDWILNDTFMPPWS